jgi:AraC family transcriptional regulator of adaptative response / DNA-3-methyladenine glycosylase II
LAARAIRGQQVTVSAAIGLAAKLLAGYGEAAQPSTTGNARLTHAFLRPERLANEEVRLGMPSARASDKRDCGRCHRRPKATGRR